MNIENQNEPLVEQENAPEISPPPKKDTSIIKQLNDKNIYPTHERIGIYVIATLTVFGILLISYTGIRLLFENTGVGEQVEYTPTPTIPTPSQETDDKQVDEDEGEEKKDERTPQTPTFPNNTTPQTGKINGDGVNIRQDASNDSIIVEQVGEGFEVTILDYDYSQEWVQISFNENPAYVWREFLNVEE